MFVGLAETLEYILTTAVNMLLFSVVCADLFQIHSAAFQIGIITLSYFVTLFLQIRGGKTLWLFGLIITFLNLLVLVIYWCGNIKYLGNFVTSASKANNDPTIALSNGGLMMGTASQFMKMMPL